MQLHLPGVSPALRVDCADIESVLAIGRALDQAVSAWLERIGASRDRLFVTLATPDYGPGLRAMLASLRRHADEPVLVMVLGDWVPDLAEHARVAAIAVPRLEKAGLPLIPGAPHLPATVSKIWAFALTRVKRFAFIDSDCLVMGPVPALFEGDGLAAVPDLLAENERIVFNSGVFAFSAPVAFWDRFAPRLPHLDSYDGGDQGMLNAAFPDWTRLPVSYNFLRTYRPMFDPPEDRLRVLHFTAAKPWNADAHDTTDIALADIDDLWIDRANEQELKALVRAWRSRALSEMDRHGWELDKNVHRIRRRLKWFGAALITMAVFQLVLCALLLLRG